MRCFQSPGLVQASPYYSYMTSPRAEPLHDTPPPSWADTFKVYLEPATLRMLSLGFAAGLPLLLVLGTLSFRLRGAGIDRTTIGYLSWVGLAYGFKWVWAPLVDRLPLPPLTTLLGRRRGWLLLAQALVIAGLVGMALIDPREGLRPLVPLDRPHKTLRWTHFGSNRRPPSARRRLPRPTRRATGSP
jgi:PAT family beta-lactamase induction signal transducer AmpG